MIPTCSICKQQLKPTNSTGLAFQGCENHPNSVPVWPNESTDPNPLNLTGRPKGQTKQFGPTDHPLKPPGKRVHI